jgi:hypothetical protein
VAMPVQSLFSEHELNPPRYKRFVIRDWKIANSSKVAQYLKVMVGFIISAMDFSIDHVL